MSGPSTPRRPPPASASSPLASSSRTPATPAPFNLTEDMDHSTATPTAYLRSSGPSSTSTPSGGANGADDSDGEDEAPDYLRLLSTLNPKSNSSSSAASSAGANIVIPKRGEKDFEPTGFGGQSKLLQRSREAMFQAVSGERRLGSRSLVKATWNATTRRAKLQDVQGKIFETVGVIRREQAIDEKTGKTVTKASNQLLPEEALFLAERASLQIYEEAQGEKEARELAPMSLQQAFAALMLPTKGDKQAQEDEPLTREAYLIYAYLKRLGYVVQRASIVDAVRAAPISASALAKKSFSSSQQQQDVGAQGVFADPQRPIKLVTIFDILLYVPRRITQLGGDAERVVARWARWAWSKTFARFLALIARASSRAAAGWGSKANAASLGLGLGLKGREDARRFLGEKGNVEWDSYDAVFSSLQIVPSGHDFWLPSTAASSPSSSTTTTEVKIERHANTSVQQAPGSEARPSSQLKPFYYAWRPATLYRKSHPPPPEFRIVILNARTHALPSIWQFESIFAHIPIPGSDQELFGTFATNPSASSCSSNITTAAEGASKAMTEEQIKERVEYEKRLKASNEAKNRAAYGKFSDGKQKFLREKAAARQAANAERALARAEMQSTLTKVWIKVKTSTVGRALIKIVLLDLELLRTVGKLFRHCPPGCWSERPKYGNSRYGGGGKFQGRNASGGTGGGRGGGGGGGNVFAPLKAGRRSVVVAVVDGSITTLLRFGESEFDKWALYGFKPQSQEQQKEAEDKPSTTALTQTK